mmetsp:Transcript_12393/g.29290  ORF Transcript_12393/g.29290 Transcript_12393/m.29290 type:complete len:93 (-) Transcript_12393:313-591(-)
MQFVQIYNRSRQLVASQMFRPAHPQAYFEILFLHFKRTFVVDPDVPFSACQFYLLLQGPMNQFDVATGKAAPFFDLDSNNFDPEATGVSVTN